MDGDITHELVVMDTAVSLEDLDVAQLFENLRPAPDAPNRGVAVSGKASLGDVEAGASPAVGDENQPEPMWAGFEGWTRLVFTSEHAIGNFGVGLNLNGSSSGFGSHGESFPPAARFFFGVQLP